MKPKICRFCEEPQGQQHLNRCQYVQRPSLYKNTMAYIDANSSPASGSHEKETADE